MASPIQAVLWDADGVLQHGRRSWPDRLTELGGPGFAEALFAAEEGPLRGTEPFRECIARLLQERRLDADPDAVLAMWEDLDVDEDAFALIDQVRAGGTPCYLATNQQDHRVALMRHTLGYDVRFDDVFYSSEMGAAKPDPEFFEIILTHLEIPAATILFIDDNATNIAAAAALGIRAEQHEPAAGPTGLRRILTEANLLAPAIRPR